MGGILTQTNEKGENNAIEFASRKLQKHKKNYPPPFLLEMQASIKGRSLLHIPGKLSPC
jgi:hypothetical protein